MRSLTLHSIIVVASILCGCAQLLGIEDTELGRPFGMPATVDGSERPEWSIPSICPLLVTFVDTWEISDAERTEALQRFVVLTNQTDRTLSLDLLAVTSVGDTSNEVELGAEIDSWLRNNQIALAPGEQIGMLSSAAENLLFDLLPVSRPRGDNVLRVLIDEWMSSAQAGRFVSVEVELTAGSRRVYLQLRLQPGNETRPLAGAYACATGE